MNHHEQERTVAPLENALNTVGNYLRKKGRAASAAAAGAALTIALVGCGAVAAEQPEKDDKGTSATPKPEATASQTPESVNYKEPKIYSDEELMTILEEPLPAELEPYAAMLPTDFEQLPIEERLPYCSYLNRDQDYLENAFYEASGDTNYLLPDNITEDTPIQEVAGNSSQFNVAALVSHVAGNIVYDRDTQQKILSCGYMHPSSANPGYAHWTNVLNSSTRSSTPAEFVENGYLKPAQIISEQPITTYTDKVTGKEYLARTISAQDDDSTPIEDTLIYVDYIDYKKQPRTTAVSLGSVLE